MNKEKYLDLTSGPILKTLTKLALPIMASSFLGTAYNLTDMAWIGMLGSKAVAGVGIGGMYVWLSQGLVSLARMGGQVNVAQSCGRGNRQDAQNYAGAAIQVTILFGLLFSAVSLAFTHPLISFFNLNDTETYRDALIYMRITCGLILFSFMNLTLTGLYTAQGDSKTPFKANLAGLVLNMILDPLLILGIGPFPRLSVAGAAIATVGSQFLVMIIMLLGIFRQNGMENVMRHMCLLRKMPGEFYHSIFRIGFPTACQGMVYCGISMILTRMVSSFGPGAIATQRVGGQIESLSWNTADGFSAALNAFVGQNYGAGKQERIRKGYHTSLRIISVWGLFIAFAFILFPVPLAKLFFHEEAVINIAKDYLIIIGLSEPFMCAEIITVGALSGLGKTKIASIITVILTAARIPLALLLSHVGMGLNGIWWALTISSVAKGIVFYFTFHRVSQRLDT